MKIKELSDYMDIMSEKYPYIPREDLKKILVHGFEQFYRLNNKRSDIHICNGRHKMYCGKMFADDEARAKYIYGRHSVKIRLLKAYEHYVYNGKYYFGLTEDEWKRYRHRGKVTFKDITLYKVPEEIFVRKKYKHLFYINYPIDVGWSFKKDKLESKFHVYFAYRDDKNNIIFNEGGEDWNT